MRIALISDMHGNAEALDAVLADMRPLAVDRVVCMGDAVQGGPQPRETLQRLREISCPVVMGNGDDILVNGMQDDEPGAEIIRDVREWSVSQLSADDLAFIAGFPPAVEL